MRLAITTNAQFCDDTLLYDTLAQLQREHGARLIIYHNQRTSVDRKLEHYCHVLGIDTELYQQQPYDMLLTCTVYDGESHIERVRVAPR